MRQIYLKILIGIIVVLWIIYFIQNVTFYKNEGFILHFAILLLYFHKIYEDFSNNYSSNIIITKLKKYKIL